jgi:hypothetical protein
MSPHPDEVVVEYSDGVVRIVVPAPRDADIATAHVLRALRAGLCAAGLREHRIVLERLEHSGVKGECAALVPPMSADPIVAAGPEIAAAVAKAAMDAYGYNPVEAIDYRPPGGPG